MIKLCFYFRQLPPVPNKPCGDLGRYCFQSEHFSKLIPHVVHLTHVFRQSDLAMIRAIRETSKGNVSKETQDFLATLNSPEKRAVILMPKKQKVLMKNLEILKTIKGKHEDFVSYDNPDVSKKVLMSVSALGVLSLKIGTNVILIANLSDSLCNGLMGVVITISDDHVTVSFQTGERADIYRYKFTAYDMKSARKIFVTEQIPLILGKLLRYLIWSSGIFRGEVVALVICEKSAM